MIIDENSTQKIKANVWQYYSEHARADLPWRQPEADGSFDAYKIMVSEIMLQQTQVKRVIQKYHEFLRAFPTVEQLASAELGDVLRLWSGLGYNRRAKYLHQAAQGIVQEHAEVLPRDSHSLTKLPGIGSNTAGAILAYAYNQPAVYIETNIRTVIIHDFFHDRADVPDAEVLEIAALLLDHENPREWYWALMDYGTYIKQTFGNLNKYSKSYTKQSTFAGSKRQLRGQVIKLLGERSMSEELLANTITDERLPAVLSDLVGEDMIRRGPDGQLHL